MLTLLLLLLLGREGRRPALWQSFPHSSSKGSEAKKRVLMYRHVSFVDCPGHDILMATMLTGAAVMNGALLLIAGNESCPQPQTGEHLAALEIIGVDPHNIVILQNKMDLVRESEATEHCESIKKFVDGAYLFLFSVGSAYRR